LGSLARRAKSPIGAKKEGRKCLGGMRKTERRRRRGACSLKKKGPKQ